MLAVWLLSHYPLSRGGYQEAVDTNLAEGKSLAAALLADPKYQELERQFNFEINELDHRYTELSGLFSEASIGNFPDQNKCILAGFVSSAMVRTFQLLKTEGNGRTIEQVIGTKANVIMQSHEKISEYISSLESVCPGFHGEGPGD